LPAPVAAKAIPHLRISSNSGRLYEVMPCRQCRPVLDWSWSIEMRMNPARTLFATSVLAAGLCGNPAHAGAFSEVFMVSSSPTHAGVSACKRGGFDPYTDGTRTGARDPTSDAGEHNGPRDPYTDGARNVSGHSDCASHSA
jgi:hypothetical protein